MTRYFWLYMKVIMTYSRAKGSLYLLELDLKVLC